MSVEIEHLLIADAGIDPEAAKQIAPFITSYQAPEKHAELEALKRSVAGVIICRKARNLLFNWREFLIKVGVNVVAAATTMNPLALIGAGLKTIADLWEGTKIPLGPKHALVVEALWIKNLEQNPVAIDAIQTHLPKEIDEAELQRILQELSILHVIGWEQGKISKQDKLILQ